MLYDTHYRDGKKVAFKKFNLNIAGLLFLPGDFDAGEKHPAVVVTHPGGGVKEQCSSLYAWNLAQAGYVTLAFDASHQGESEGLPRYLEDPASRVEDIRSAVDYLMTLEYVDEERIGAMGVCAGVGYTLGSVNTIEFLFACKEDKPALRECTLLVLDRKSGGNLTRQEGKKA